MIDIAIKGILNSGWWCMGSAGSFLLANAMPEESLLDAAGWTLVLGGGAPELAADELSTAYEAVLDYFPPGTDPEGQWNITVPDRDISLPWWWGSTSDASPTHYTVFAEAGRWRVLAHGSGLLLGHPDTSPAATVAPWAAEFSEIWNGEDFFPISTRVDIMGGPALCSPQSEHIFRGPFADDAAAAPFVPVGAAYRKPGGVLAWRQA